MIAPFVAFGWLGGMIYLFGSFTVVAQACLAARRTRSPAASVLAIMALTCLASSVFEMFIGVQGLMIWFSAGYASAIGVKARISRPAASRPRRSLVGAQRDFSQNWSGGASANIAPEV